MKLNLTRPLVFFDLETTGVNVGTDKIVEISMLK
jgi:DNA polymerase-3 subunit epsilon